MIIQTVSLTIREDAIFDYSVYKFVVGETAVVS